MNWPVQRPRKAEDDDPKEYWGSSFPDPLCEHDTVFKDDENSGKELALDDVPFDRDVRWVNVAIGSRPRSRISSNNPFMKQVQSIASHNASELPKLDEHYRDLDKKKLAFDNQLQGSKRLDRNNGIHRESRERKEMKTSTRELNKNNASFNNQKVKPNQINQSSIQRVPVSTPELPKTGKATENIIFASDAHPSIVGVDISHLNANATVFKPSLLGSIVNDVN